MKNKINIERRINENSKKDNKYGKYQDLISSIDRNNDVHEVSIIEIHGTYEAWIPTKDREFEAKHFNNFVDAINYAIVYLSFFEHDIYGEY